MREIALFVEDYAHQQIIGALVRRISVECNTAIRLDWRVAVGGHGKVITELNDYMRDLKRQGSPWPDLIVVATDANCEGLNKRAREVVVRDDLAPMIFAIPDPHIERWLLLDGAAFKAVFGKGCDAPDQKCDRGRYKQQLIEAIYATGTIPRLGGIEYAEDIVEQININRAARADRSFRRFVADLRNTFQGWQS
ncbi:MAG: DUF4276 family protein [Gemmatimonadota bacterium]|nr:DUF4276 family protein [Gemmatimonadota bacterium]